MLILSIFLFHFSFSQINHNIESAKIHSTEDRLRYENMWVDSIKEVDLADFVADSLLGSEIQLFYYTNRLCIPCVENMVVLDSVGILLPEVPIYSFYNDEKYLDSNSYTSIGVQPELAKALMCYATPTIFVVKNNHVCSIKSGGPGIDPKYEFHVTQLINKIKSCKE
mgnify:FL=1